MGTRAVHRRHLHRHVQTTPLDRSPRSGVCGVAWRGRLLGVDEHVTDIPGTDGWRYGPFRTNDAGDRRTITLVHESGFETTVELPDFVSQGEEVGEIARIVIAAWERQEALKGVGG